MTKKITSIFIILMVVAINLFAVPVRTPYGNYSVYVLLDPDGTYEGNVRAAEVMVPMGLYQKATLPKSVLDAVINFVKKEYSWQNWVQISVASPDNKEGFVILLNKRGDYVIYEFLLYDGSWSVSNNFHG